MSATRRTRLVAVVATLLLGSGLAACGEDDGSAQDPTGVNAGGGLDQLEIDGDFGAEPELTWKDSVTVTETESETLVEGDGDTVENGDLVLTSLLLANGVDEKVLANDFAEGGEPQLIPLSDQLIPAIRDQLDGATIGSRIVVAAPPADAFGENGNPQLGIGNEDTVVFVMDVTGTVPSEPDGAAQDPAAWMPKVTQTDGSPTGLDFTDAPKPTKNLQVDYLIKGSGDEAAAGDQLYVNYLGQVYGGKEPFDDSYSTGQPFNFVLGQGQVVEGWDQGLEGVPVGSRVILAIPPSLGYGKEGQGDIKADDTMYFVIDVLAAN